MLVSLNDYLGQRKKYYKALKTAHMYVYTHQQNRTITTIKTIDKLKNCFIKLSIG